MKMKVPCCSVCQTRYNEKERVPLLLQCGHGFCKECLSRMFSASTDTTLSCPRCRHVSVVGNSVTALRKNFAVLALILSANNTNQHHNSNSNHFDSDVTDDDDDDEDDEVDDYENINNNNNSNNYDEDGDVGGRFGRGTHVSSSGVGVCGPVIEVGVHHDVKLVKKLGEGRRAGVEVWGAWIGGGQGRCRHSVAVKKVMIAEEMEPDWLSGQLDNLRRASMWCRNVCTFHGVLRMDSCLGLVMDRCYGSVQLAMQRNEGRLTLEQILRWS